MNCFPAPDSLLRTAGGVLSNTEPQKVLSLQAGEGDWRFHILLDLHFKVSFQRSAQKLTEGALENARLDDDQYGTPVDGNDERR